MTILELMFRPGDLAETKRENDVESIDRDRLCSAGFAVDGGNRMEAGTDQFLHVQDQVIQH